jgi:OmpR family response regulator RpaB
MALFSKKTNGTILIAEDEPSLRRVLSKKLISMDYKVIEAADGEEAIDIAFKEKPDLIILDELMPKVTGTGVIKRLRKDENWGKDVPVFILTNIDEGTNTYDQVKDLANKYYIKSDTPLNTILEAITETLGTSQ